MTTDSRAQRLNCQRRGVVRRNDDHQHKDNRSDRGQSRRRWLKEKSTTLNLCDEIFQLVLCALARALMAGMGHGVSADQN